MLLILLCTLATISSAIFGDLFPTDKLCFSKENLNKGYFWTPITALFLHVNIAHLIGNMLFLYVFGSTLEKEVGFSRTAASFFLGGALSFILSSYFYEDNTIMIGASAAIFTLVAIVMLVKPLKFSWLFLMPLGLVAILYFIYNIFAVYYPQLGEPGVSYLGHIIGFLVGVPFGIAWSRGRWKRNLLITITLLVIYYLIISVF
mgnify:CR=1 FL=1